MLDLQLFAIAPLFMPVRIGAAMNAKVVIIEDDEDIANLISMYLKRDGIETVVAHSGESGLESFREGDVDLVVLDINLPGMDGYEVLQAIKKERDVPVVMVTARQEDEDAILGFGMGADDYVAKPFSPKVLAARIRTHLSRVRKAAGEEDGITRGSPGGHLMEFGPYQLDSRTYSLLKNGEKLTMSPREIDLLIHLARHPGEPQSQETLYRTVWERQYGDISTVAVHIQRIRKKIEEDSARPRWIKTFHGRGYYLDPEGTE